MTRDDIIRIADRAGVPLTFSVMTIEQIVTIASLVAAAEREACAKVCLEIEESCWETWDSLADPADQGSAIGAAHCAQAIRARVE